MSSFLFVIKIIPNIKFVLTICNVNFKNVLLSLLFTFKFLMCLKNGVRLWYNELSHCIGELVEDLAAPFLVQFPVNVSRKVEEDG